MICRLCLDELNDDFFPIFAECENKETNETEVAKVIKKYFHIKLSDEDNVVVSNKICTSCWYQLNDFHQFWLRIEQKQETLQWEHSAAVVDIKSEVVLVKEEEGKEQQPTEKKQVWQICASLNDEQKEIKDIVLCEPEIHINVEPERCLDAGHEFAAADQSSATTSSANSSQEERDDDNVPERKRLLHKIKCTKSIAKLKRRGNRIGKRREVETDTISIAEVAELTGKAKSSVRRELDAYLTEKAAQLRCSLCALDNFSCFGSLLEHFREEHHRPGYMLCCDKRFHKRSLYADHLKWHDNPEIFKCSKCNKCMSGQRSFKSHLAFMHPPEGEQILRCEFCPRKFSKQYVLTCHIKSHYENGAENKQICGLCKMSFRYRGELKSHLKNVHSHEVGHMCDICGKNLKTKHNLLAHIQAVHHVGEKLPEVQCEVCEKWFRNEHSLEGHMYKHRDEASGRQYVCNICGVVKATRQTLHSHKKYHHSPIIFNCTMCEKTFKRELNLREHVATHTGEALYHCEVCGQTFRSHRNKYAHTKKAHPERLLRKDERPKPIKPPTTSPRDLICK